jgi:Zn-dependent M28 family amino/carboxypeptidase
VAVLAEMAYLMPELDIRYGVDFVLFDGEELVFNPRTDKFFLGSEHFAEQYAANPPPYRYRWGVLLDMIGDAQLQIYKERNSVMWPDTRPLVRDIWDTAKRLGVREFIPRTRHQVNDDHLALRNMAGIPTCDVIDFDYPRPGFSRSYWHTEADTPDKCSALSLAKVGWVIYEWLKNVE